MAVRADLAAVLAMLDRSHFTTVVERWEGRVSGQASETGPRVACISSWGRCEPGTRTACRPRADRRSGDLLGWLGRLLRGLALVIPSRRLVQMPALREFRIPHIREFGNTYLCFTPEISPEARDQAFARGQQRFAAWRSAVARILKASGQPVPWPLADSEGVDGRAASGSHAATSGGSEADPPPLRPSGI
jgi:hypothetical protein